MLIPVMKRHYTMLQRNLLYTGVTRGKRLVVLVGQKKAVAIAVRSDQLRRSLGCTNAIESLMAVLRQVCRNVKRWRDALMALRWTGTAMLEAEKSFRRLKAHKQLPILKAALQRHQQALLGDRAKR